jgi:hypothetical protein
MRAVFRTRALALFTLLFAGAAPAHELRPAYLEIRESVPGRYQVLWKVPQRGEYVLGLKVLWPPGARDAAPPAEESVGDALIQRRVMEFGRDGLVGKHIAIDGLATTTTDVLVRIEFLDGRVQTHLLKPGNATFIVPARRPALEVARDYLVMGTEHIFGGFDHLLFVLGLLLLVSGLSRLVKTITAFTLAHSLTLGFATLGLVRVPQAPVEAAIALSIVFLARELIVHQRGNGGIATRRPWLMSFGFGLLHGFGFAGALSAVGLPQGDVPLALAGFNAGVEVGQLLFVGAALLVVAGARRIAVRAPAWLRAAPAYGIGSLAAFWTIARVAAFR